jgi:hypothetical protein
MRKWIWASALLTVAVACGLYGVVRWADRHPLSVMGYGARLVSVAGLGHARVSASRPAPEQVEEGPHAIVEELPNAGPQEDVSEPIVVEHSQPLPPEGSEPPVSEPGALPPVAELASPVMEMPPCPEDVVMLRIDNAFRKLADDHFDSWQPGIPSSASASPSTRTSEPQTVSQEPNSTIIPVKGEIPNCEVDPNYHHLYPGCPWMGGCQNIPAFLPALPAEAARRVRPGKSKWVSVLCLMEAMGLSGMEAAEEPVTVPEEEPSNLTDIIF